MGGVVKTVKSVGSSVASGVSNAVESTTDAVSNVVEETVETASNVATVAKDTVENSVSNAWDLAAEGAEAVVDYAGDQVANVAGDLVDAGKGALEAVTNAGSGIVENLKEGDILGAVGSAAQGVGDLVVAELGAVGAVNPLNVLGVQDEISSGVSSALGGVRGALNKGVEAYTGAVGDVLHDGFSAVGLEGVGDFAQRYTEEVGNFTQGAIDGTVGLAGGVAQLAIDPAGTAQGLVHLASHPDQLDDVGKALWSEATEHGAAGAAGYLAANLAPTILSGGSTAAGTAANAASKAARVARVAKAADGAADASRLGNLASKLSQARTSLGGVRHAVSHADVRTALEAFAKTNPKAAEVLNSLSKPLDDALSAWQKLNAGKHVDDFVKEKLGNNAQLKEFLMKHGIPEGDLHQALIDSGALVLHLNNLYGQQAEE